MPVDRSLLGDIKANAAKKFKADTIHSGAVMPPVYRIPFQSLELNLATYGGAPMGRMCRFWGGPSSGKSLTCWGLAKSCQDHRSERFPEGLTVAYYNVEGQFDPVYCRDVIGLDIEEPMLTIVEGGIIEDLSYKLDALLGAVNVHIIDSASFAESTHTFEADKASQQPGFEAKAWKKALKSAEERMDKQDNMIILVDHETQDFKTGAAKPVGGKVIEHASSLSLQFRKAKKLYRTTENGPLSDTRPQKGNDALTGGHVVNGYEVEIEVVKSRVCRPHGKARIILDLDNLSFDNLFELEKAGIFLGVIQQSGSYFKVPNEEKSIQGKDKLKERLANDFSLASQIMSAAQDYMKKSAYA